MCLIGSRVLLLLVLGAGGVLCVGLDRGAILFVSDVAHEIVQQAIDLLEQGSLAVYALSDGLVVFLRCSCVRACVCVRCS